MSVTSCLHPVFKDLISSVARAQVDMVSAIRGYKPKQPHLALEMPSSFVNIKIKGKKSNKEDSSVEESGPKDSFKDDEFLFTLFQEG